ncbi:MAG: hypothetical protein IJZ72_00660 [Oscillospiraceae bacterium]|nr:hypothetical protein [Oscillospiraceae bacterium]
MKIRNFVSGVLAAAVMTVSLVPVTVSADEWVKTSKGYVYKYDDGSTAKKGWLEIDGKLYYIQKDGTRKTGWLKTTSGRYYLGKDGAMYKSRWLKLKSGKKYYLKSDGKAVTGLAKIGNVVCKFGDDGLYLGENHKFILNKDTQCLHGKECRNAEKISDENYDEVNIGTEEFDEKSTDGFWACGVKGCNSSEVRKALPKK